MKDKLDNAYKSIGEVAKLLNLVNLKTGKLNTHTIRFWEKEFNQIKPKILAGKRRYYSNKEIRIIKLIKYLLKERGMTIKGTTLQEFDVATSFKKKIRKPDAILPEVLNAGKVKLRKLMDTIAAKEGKVTGRINKDMIILRVI